MKQSADPDQDPRYEDTVEIDHCQQRSRCDQKAEKESGEIDNDLFHVHLFPEEQDRKNERDER